jgi:hypothetical protein
MVYKITIRVYGNLDNGNTLVVAVKIRRQDTKLNTNTHHQYIIIED